LKIIIARFFEFSLKPVFFRIFFFLWCFFFFFFLQITLSGPLSCVSGHYNSNSIKSLKFVCGYETYGPYGKQLGTYFKYEASSEAAIVGFHGRRDFPSGRLTAIGVHVEIILDSNIYKIHNEKIENRLNFKALQILALQASTSARMRTTLTQYRG
jgi:hypothetical protein